MSGECPGCGGCGGECWCDPVIPKPQSVREVWREIRIEMRQPDLSPMDAMDLLIKATGWYPNVLEEVREAELAYNEVELTAMNSEEAANRARIKAKASPEYARYREAKDVEKGALEAIRSLKRYLQAKQEEMRLAR